VGTGLACQALRAALQPQEFESPTLRTGSQRGFRRGIIRSLGKRAQKLGSLKRRFFGTAFFYCSEYWCSSVGTQTVRFRAFCDAVVAARFLLRLRRAQYGAARRAARNRRLFISAHFPTASPVLVLASLRGLCGCAANLSLRRQPNRTARLFRGRGWRRRSGRRRHRA